MYEKPITYSVFAVNMLLVLGLVSFPLWGQDQKENSLQNNKDQQPNILLVISDQLTPFLMGTYGHPVVKTPHLDKLAKRGIRFDNAYVPNPICAPARACLMTGKYSSNNKVYDNAAPLYCDQPTIAHYLTNAGYDAALSGKAHFVGADQLHGFNKRLTPNIYPTDFRWTKSRDNKIPRGHARAYTGAVVNIGILNERLIYDEETHLRSLQYLIEKGSENIKSKESENSYQPFFLVASYHHPHEPFDPPQEFWDLYETEAIDIPEFPENMEETYSVMDKWLNTHHGVSNYDIKDPESLRRVRRAYYALVTYMDDKVGELIKSLEDNGLADNTVIIFTSDHGDMLGEKGMVQKRSFYEWSSRVPLIISYPDGRAAGTVVDQPVSLIDIQPTVLDIVGINQEERLPMDGKSLLGLINGDDTEERIVFSEMHSEGVYSTCFMVRKGKYKYNYIHGYDAQLFNLENDPGEWNNLAGKPDYKKLEKELKSLILEAFNPNEIEKELRASLLKRELIRSAMRKNNVDWRFIPKVSDTD